MTTSATITNLARIDTIRTRLSGKVSSRLLSIGALALSGLIVAGVAHRIARGLPLLPGGPNLWLLVHLATVVPAVPLGAWLLARPKGDVAHRLLGRVWAVLMLITAVASFGLHSLTGGLSPIHALSVLTIVSVTLAVRHAMRGNVAAHKRMISRMVAGLVVAGLFTFIPGRLMFAWLVG